jgi:heme-degrading monooxygenase HmoA
MWPHASGGNGHFTCSGRPRPTNVPVGADKGRHRRAARTTMGSVPALTPEPPYTAVIFTSIRTSDDADGYARAAADMEDLARAQPGYLGIESARDPASGLGITVSYWADDDAARAWKQVAEHRDAQRLGRERWYREYRVRVARVHRVYGARGDCGA